MRVMRFEVTNRSPHTLTVRTRGNNQCDSAEDTNLHSFVGKTHSGCGENKVRYTTFRIFISGGVRWTEISLILGHFTLDWKERSDLAVCKLERLRLSLPLN